MQCATQGVQGVFVKKKDLLYREFSKGNKTTLQLVVPEGFREKVMRLAHETLMYGHLGIKKTLDRVVAKFFWPGICGHVARFYKSCDICQRTIQKGRVSKVPLGSFREITINRHTFQTRRGGHSRTD